MPPRTCRAGSSRQAPRRGRARAAARRGTPSSIQTMISIVARSRRSRARAAAPQRPPAGTSSARSQVSAEQHLPLVTRRARRRPCPARRASPPAAPAAHRSSITDSSCTQITASRPMPAANTPPALPDDQDGELATAGIATNTRLMTSLIAQRPPKRRTRASYDARASSKSAREKSGHSTSVKCSSEYAACHSR